MANMTVRDRSGFAGWLWVIIALCALAVIFWGWGWGWGWRGGYWHHRYHTVSTVAAPAANTGNVAGNAAIMQLSTIFAAPDQDRLAGARANLNGVAVQQTLGDRVFTVGPSGGEVLYAVLGRDINQGAAGALLTPGRKLDLVGEVERGPRQAQGELPAGVNAREAALLQGQRVFLLVTGISGERTE